jgi:hypothetical protein
VAKSDQKARDYWYKGGWTVSQNHSRGGLNPCVAEDLAALLRQRGWSSAADYGAGTGAYAHELRRLGVQSVACYDLDASTATASNGLCAVHDLTKPDPLPVVDLVYSLEVGDHIAPELEPAFLDSLTRGAAHGVVLSWAVPGQPGSGHVNSQTPQHVSEAMRQRGFIKDQVESSLIRSNAQKKCRDAPSTAAFGQSLMVFFRTHPEGMFPGWR